MRDELDGGSVDLARAGGVAGDELFKDGVLEPEVDVAPPEALLGDGRHAGDGALVDGADLRDVAVLLLEADVVEPDVVVGRDGRLGGGCGGGGGELLLVAEAALADEDVLDRLARAVGLLEGCEGGVERVGARARDVVERVAVDGARALVLVGALLEGGKGDKEARVVAELAAVAAAERVDGARVDVARARGVVLRLLEARVAQPRADGRSRGDEALVHAARARDLADAQLKLGVREPRGLGGVPLHPALKDEALADVVAEHVLHERVLVPQLRLPRQDVHRAVPHVPRAVAVAVPHLELRVLEPERHVPRVLVHRPLVHAPRAVQLVLALLPHRVLQVRRHARPVPPQRVLKLLPLVHPVLLQLVLVRNDPSRRHVLPLRPVRRLLHQLLRSDLHRRSRFVLHMHGSCQPRASSPFSSPISFCFQWKFIMVFHCV